MSLVWWPLTLLVLLVAIAGVAVLWWRERGRSDGDAVLAAHTDRLTRLPRYRAALARLRLRLIALGAVLPGPFRALGRMEVAQVNIPVAVLIWAMIVPMLLRVDFAAMGQVTRHWRGIAVTLGINWLVKPFSMALLG